MKKFEELKANLFKSFGVENEEFHSIKQTFPKTVELALGDKSERKLLKISYSSVINDDNKVNKILCCCGNSRCVDKWMKVNFFTII